MKKIYLFIIFLALFSFGIAGCSKENNADDVKNYVKSEFGLSKFKVTEDIIPENSEYRNVWTVSVNEAESFSFKVVQGSSSGLFGSEYYLFSDYDSILTSICAQKYGYLKNLYIEESTDELGIRNAIICADYTNKNNLKELYQEIDKFLAYAGTQKHVRNINITLRLTYFLRNQLPDHEETSGDYYFSGAVFEGKDRSAVEINYLSVGVSYNIPEILAEFTTQEIESYIAGTNDCIGICSGTPEKDEYVYYTDIAGKRWGYGVSFGTLYEILMRQGFEVNGDWKHYSFIGIDGATYEISYDFADAVYEENGRAVLGYYYLVNGEPKATDYFWYNTFGKKEIRNMTGIELICSAMNNQPYLKNYTEEGIRREITSIYLDGEEMTYNTVENTINSFRLSTDDYRFIRYSEADKAYRIYIDYAMPSKNGSYPLILAEYVKALGGKYTLCEPEKKNNVMEYKATWTLDGDSYVLVTRRTDESSSQQTCLYKNKQKMDIELMDGESGSFVFEIPVEEFVKIFGLEFEIDQENGAVFFTSHK